MEKEQFVAVIRKQLEEGNRLYNDAVHNEGEGDVVAIYWDGFRDCADAILKEITEGCPMSCDSNSLNTLARMTERERGTTWVVN